MALADILAELLASEGTVVPDGFSDTIMGAYNDDIAAANADSNSIIAAKEEMIQSLKAAAAIESIPASAADTLDTPDAEDGESDDANFDDFFGEAGDDDDPDRK